MQRIGITIPLTQHAVKTAWTLILNMFISDSHVEKGGHVNKYSVFDEEMFSYWYLILFLVSRKERDLVAGKEQKNHLIFVIEEKVTKVN